jgi:hypothetical protein
MEKIKDWYIGLTDKQAAGVAVLLVCISPFAYILLFLVLRIVIDDTVCLVIFGLLYIYSFVYWLYLDRIRDVYVLSKSEKEKQQIKKVYELAKNKLRQQPSNNQLREKALQAGREYYKSLRNGQLSIYDEQAITNDLAAVAPISQANNTVKPNTNQSDENSQSDIVVKLEKLNLLKNKGIISQSEFEAKKKDLIDRM